MVFYIICHLKMIIRRPIGTYPQAICTLSIYFFHCTPGIHELLIAELLVIHVTIPINASHIMLLIVDILSPSCFKTSWKFNKYIRSSEALFRFSKLQKIAIHKHKKQKKKKKREKAMP